LSAFALFATHSGSALLAPWQPLLSVAKTAGKLPHHVQLPKVANECQMQDLNQRRMSTSQKHNGAGKLSTAVSHAHLELLLLLPLPLECLLLPVPQELVVHNHRQHVAHDAHTCSSTNPGTTGEPQWTARLLVVTASHFAAIAYCTVADGCRS
jgi:hypothetical protein